MTENNRKVSRRTLLMIGIVLGMIAGAAVHYLREPNGHGQQLDPDAAFPTLDEEQRSAEQRRADEKHFPPPPAGGPDAPHRNADEQKLRGKESRSEKTTDETPLDADEAPAEAPKKLAQATFGAGCFWCTEAYFESLKGVVSVEAGFSGGHVKNPSYLQVCTGDTGHAEVAHITYDPAVVSYGKLLEVFWRTHDPTTLNRQGGDVGEQYRSAIFYHNASQRQLAEKYKRKLDAAHIFAAPIVTQIEPFKKFYPAGDGHQDFYRKNPSRSYCRVLIRPTLEKMKAVLGEAVKDSP